MSFTKNISLSDLSGNFGCDINEFGNHFVKFYNSLDMRYDLVSGEDYENLVLEILRKIDTDTQVIGVPERTGIWHDGWKENLDDFLTKKKIGVP